MVTEYKENVYKFSQKRKDQQQIPLTNALARTILHREMCVVVSADDKAFIGFCAEPDGIAEDATGMVDLMPNDIVTTNQFTTASFLDNTVRFWVLPQTALSQALIKLASTSLAYPLDALIEEYTAGTLLRFRMPVQDGTAVAVA